MARPKPVEPILGFYVGGQVNEQGVGAALKALFLYGGGQKLEVMPVFHPDFDPANQVARRKEMKMLPAPTEERQAERGKVREATISSLLAMKEPTKFSEWKRAVAREAGVSPAGVEYHARALRKEGLCKLQGGMLVPNEGKLNRLRNREQGETSNA